MALRAFQQLPFKLIVVLIVTMVRRLAIARGAQRTRCGDSQGPPAVDPAVKRDVAVAAE